MKTNNLAALSTAIILAFGGFFGEATSKENLSASIERYDTEDFARYMQMTPSEYIKFISAYGEKNKSNLALDLIDIRSQPTFTEILSLSKAGKPVSKSSLMQLEVLFKKNKEKFQERMGMTDDELEAAIIRYDNLVSVVSGLEKIKGKLGRSYGTNSDDNDVEVIVIIGSEDLIRETTSGGFTSLNVKIYDSGMSIGEGFTVYIRVQFNSLNGSNQGSQLWRVNRFGAVPYGNFSCSNEMCGVVPF